MPTLTPTWPVTSSAPSIPTRRSGLPSIWTDAALARRKWPSWAESPACSPACRPLPHSRPGWRSAPSPPSRRLQRPAPKKGAFGRRTPTAAGPVGSVIPIGQTAKRGRRRPPLLLLAAAVAAVIGLVVGIVTSGGGSSTPSAVTIRLVSVSGGPAHGTAQVRPTPGGLTIDMTVEDLAPSPPGTFYTCWLVGPGDSLRHPNRVSVGSFVVQGSSPVHVHWTTAADPHRFPQLGVTLEPANGNPSHQGPKVLAGTVAA